MMICRECGRTFTAPKVRTEYTGVSSEVWHEKFEYDTCPYCGSDEVQEAVRCDYCGEWSEDWTCEDCKVTISKFLTNIIEHGISLHKLNGQKPDRHDVINAISGVLEDI